MVFSLAWSWMDLFWIGGPITSYLWNDNVAWVPDDTIYKLPPMNVDPNFITTTGFSGGSYYAMNFAIIHSKTIQGAGMRAGGPYGAGFDCSKGEFAKCDDAWRADMVTYIKGLADEGLIDPVSNLKDKPMMIRGGSLDES